MLSLFESLNSDGVGFGKQTIHPKKEILKSPIVVIDKGLEVQVDENKLKEIQAELKNYLLFPNLTYPKFEDDRKKATKDISSAYGLLKKVKVSKTPLLSDIRVLYTGLSKKRLENFLDHGAHTEANKEFVVHLASLKKEELKNVENFDSLSNLANTFCGFKGNGLKKEFEAKEVNLMAVDITDTGVTCKKCLAKMLKTQKLFAEKKS